jgi:hypothetical protein
VKWRPIIIVGLTRHVQVNVYLIDPARCPGHHRQGHRHCLAGRDDCRAGHLVRDLPLHRRGAAGHARSQQPHPRDQSPGRRLLALIDLAAGVVALVWPGPTALVLVLVVAIWAFVLGFAEVFAAFGVGETASARAMYIVTGLISIAFGSCSLPVPGSARSPSPGCSCCLA